jgi:uncharacterized protein with PIN domain
MSARRSHRVVKDEVEGETFAAFDPAHAVATGEAHLFKGDDFGLTDIRRA